MRRRWSRARHFRFSELRLSPSMLIVFSAVFLSALILFSLIYWVENREKQFSFKDIDSAIINDIYLYDDLNKYIDFHDYTQSATTDESKGDSSFQLSTLEVKNYRVKKGETLGGIARRFGLRIGTLISYNQITDVRKVREGSELQIPSADGILYKVGRGDSIEGLASRYNSDFNLILDYNNLSSEVIQIGQTLFLPGVAIDDYSLNKALGRLFEKPTKGRLTSLFGYRTDPFTGKRRMHNGLDIANRLGTPIRASMEGKVLYVDHRPKGYGKVVVLQHRDGYQTLYAHLNRIDVKKGDWIVQGGQIGAMGSTGRSTGSHLHFSIYKNNTALNPLNFVHY